MIQHLLNTTAIWLLCLLAYDLFLRRETFHTYNRIYLLSTLAIGLLLPLWEWAEDSVVYSAAFREPVIYIGEAKQNIGNMGNSVIWDWEMYIGAVYLVGLLVATLLLSIDVVKVLRLYKRGIKSTEDNWVVVQTAQAHSPFSIFNFLFVNSKDQYTQAQWAVLLAHEHQHRSRLHFFDLLVIQLTQVVFWFHPLVHFYNRRLLMVHEYEADSAVKSPVNEYGQFLVEQAMLGNAPVITHSFNRSPIKKRIVMLTRKSSGYKRLKLFIGLPVILACILFFTQLSYAQQKKIQGNIVTYKGNKIELNEGGIDTIEVLDPVTGETQKMYEKREPSPISFNGSKVHNMRSVDRKPAMKGIDFQDYLKERLVPVMKGLSDGTYQVHISNLVLDEDGKLAYYDLKGFSKRPANGESAADAQKEIADDVNRSVAKIIEKALDELPINPARVGGKPVITYLDDFSFMYTTLEIKDHKIR